MTIAEVITGAREHEAFGAHGRDGFRRRMYFDHAAVVGQQQIPVTQDGAALEEQTGLLAIVERRSQAALRRSAKGSTSRRTVVRG